MGRRFFWRKRWNFWRKRWNSNVFQSVCQSHLKVSKHLCPNFLEFCLNFPSIFDKSKLFGVPFAPLHPSSYTTGRSSSLKSNQIDNKRHKQRTCLYDLPAVVELSWPPVSSAHLCVLQSVIWAPCPAQPNDRRLLFKQSLLRYRFPPPQVFEQVPYVVHCCHVATSEAVRDGTGCDEGGSTEVVLSTAAKRRLTQTEILQMTFRVCGWRSFDFHFTVVSTALR